MNNFVAVILGQVKGADACQLTACYCEANPDDVKVPNIPPCPTMHRCIRYDCIIHVPV